MSSLGMNSKGEVRSASEFKDIFEDTGESHGPYKCPFCEIRYEDRCIVTECVKAPHFKLPTNTKHAGGCNGEAGGDASSVVTVASRAPKRTVVGGIELPEALVMRRKALIIRKTVDEADGSRPDATEILRRRRQVANDKTLSSHYTTSQLRALVQAYKKLRKYAYDQAVAAKLKPGTVAYNKSFGKTLDSFNLSLYGQHLTYGKAFQGSKLRPWDFGRIYFGSGKVFVDGAYLVIKDSDLWPKLMEGEKVFVQFCVKLGRTLTSDAPTSHIYALEKLERIAVAGDEISWHAYGLPTLQDGNYELVVDSLDHLYWHGQHDR